MRGLSVVLSQGHIGSCTAYALAGIIQVRLKQNKDARVPSAEHLWSLQTQVKGVIKTGGALMKSGAMHANHCFSIIGYKYDSKLVAKGGFEVRGLARALHQVRPQS